MPNVAWLLERRKWERKLQGYADTCKDLVDMVARREKELERLRAANAELREFAESCSRGPYQDSDLTSYLAWIQRRATAILTNAEATATAPESAPAAPR